MDLIGKMKSSVRFCINMPTAQGAGHKDNYGVLLTTRGWLRKSHGNRTLTFGEIEGQSGYLLTVRYQQALAANLSISTKIIINNVWHTVDSWDKKEEEHKTYYEFKLNRKEPVTSEVQELPVADSNGILQLILNPTVGETSVLMGIVPDDILLLSRTGVVHTKTEGSPGNLQFTVSGDVLNFQTQFNASEVIYVLYKTSS